MRESTADKLEKERHAREIRELESKLRDREKLDSSKAKLDKARKDLENARHELDTPANDDNDKGEEMKKQL